MKSERIIIRGARQHNLKNIDVEFPRNKLVVVTGLSGSGKSTLAFDTLYAEGQRRYVESLSTYARQFLGQMDKPDVDMIEGLSPAIAIEQKTASHNPRSTVGTVTEIYDFLRLLYARAGTPYCHKCGKEITAQSLDQIIGRILSFPENSRLIILAPLVTGKKGVHSSLLKQLRRDGFTRVKMDGEIYEIDDLPPLGKSVKHTIEAVIDRLILKDGIKNRLADSLELALSMSDGLVSVEIQGGETVLFSEKAACANCNISYPEFTPASFSFNSPQGACSKCDGIGSTTEFDPDLIVPNRALSLREGAVVLWANRNSVQFAEFLDALTGHYRTDIYTPFSDLPPKLIKTLFRGSGKEEIPFYFEQGNRKVTYKKTYEGIIPGLKRRLAESGSGQAREEIKQFMSNSPCPNCHGSRLNRASRNVTLGGLPIHAVTAMPIDKCLEHISSLNLTGTRQTIADKIVKEIIDRLVFLKNVGLSYLTLDRAASTLSGGESQRIRLATQIGSKLTGVLYVLDEPSIGLHQRDNSRLLATLLRMRDLGNTVLVVEHDDETIAASDHVIDMGPAAGVHGGQVIFSGPPRDLVKSQESLTGQYMSGRKKIHIPSNRRTGNGNSLKIEGASANNLKDVNISIPLGCLTCVTGVSGSGKSTLVNGTIGPLLSQRLYNARVPAGIHKAVTGLEYLDKVVNIDQSPIGRTPRSNPATYTGVFSFIRELFAKTAESRARGYKAGRFSFNIKGGRCEACGGDGIVKIEMHFLPDVYVTCDVCKGRRYNRETLEIRYKGKNIDEVLNMTVNQSVAFFDKIGPVKTKLQTLVDVGVGYIRLGQSATTLSGGEAQRIKLAKELSKKSTGRTIYILDEPTTGLHIEDISKLLSVLNRLVNLGNTVLVIEHNLDVIKHADHIIDLGPEGGDMGGEVIASGTPEEIARCGQSYTGMFLKKHLERG